MKNTTEESIDVTVDLQLDGLTNTREQVLGTLLLAPLQSTILKWDPSAAPIRPVGTSAQAHVRVRYSIGDAQIRATVASLSYATSNDGAVMYLSPNDDNAVRLASKGREASHATLTAADREILLQELGSRHGWLDGARIDLDPSDITSRTVAPGVVARGNSMPLPTNDTISLPGSPVAAEQLTQEEGQPSEATTETELAPQDIPIIPVCQFSPIVYARVGKVCMYYRPDFLDSYVTSSVVSPDFDPYNSQASYANARIYASGATTDIWSGRLDADGCTPEVTYCASSMRAELQLNSIRVPNRTSGGALILGTRDIQISPPAYYTATTYLGSDAITGAPLAWAYVSSTSNPKQIRVASIVSELLRKSDNGVKRLSIGTSTPALTIKLDNGCFGYNELMYAPGQYGGACASANVAEFGPEVDPSTTPPTLVGTHTTQSSYVIAHELGHSAQHSNNGANIAAVGTYDPPLSGMCSCEHVNIGNRLHCLQSLDHITLIHREGFAHHYATRIFNDKGSDARFTYYKNFRSVTWTGPSTYLTWNNPPPRAVSAGQPFLGFPSNPNGPFRGWAKSFCGGFSDENTEYDYLRFFWAINGSASSGEQSSLANVFSIFGQDPTIPLTWTSIGTKAANVHNTGTPKYNRVYNSLFAHGLNQ